MTNEALTGYRVLVVEDDYFVAEELAAVLQENGAIVLGPASNLEAGRSLAREQAPDCVLLDVDLRGECAFELAGELRERGIFTVLATGYDSDFVPPHLEEAAYLRKPLPLGTLLHLIRSHAPRTRPV